MSHKKDEEVRLASVAGTVPKRIKTVLIDQSKTRGQTLASLVGEILTEWVYKLAGVPESMIPKNEGQGEMFNEQP